MRVLPLLLAAAVLIVASGTSLIAQEDANAPEFAAALLLMGAGLVLLGAWAAVEIRELHHRDDPHRDDS